MSTDDIKKLDPNMAWLPADDEGLKWHLPYEAPLKLCGFAWFDQLHAYRRLPDPDPASTVTQFPNGLPTTLPVEKCLAYQLAKYTAGGQIRFRTDSSCFALKGLMKELDCMDNMTSIGSSGFDLYLKCGGAWKCFGVTRTDHSKCDFSATMLKNLGREMHDVIINFPLYNGVKSLAVGLDEDARIEPPTPFLDNLPIVWYGTSIQEGGCASRPGLASSNMLSRMLEQEVLNLAFSGNGKGEPEIAKLLADIDARAYLIDYTWNVEPKELEVSLPRFLDIIRSAHPTAPIVLIGPTPGTISLPEVRDKRLELETQTMREEFTKRAQAGDQNIYFFDTMDGAMGEDDWECTVDGVHLNDLGFYRFTQAFYPFLKDILNH